MSYQIRQKARYAGSHSEDWWEWEVWIEADDEGGLDEVESVEYYLHPTFPKPIVRVRDRDSGFRLRTSGWGEFLIRARVRLGGEAEDRHLTHWLELRKPEGSRALERKGRGRAKAKQAGRPTPPPQSVMLSFGPGEEGLADELAEVLRGEGIQVSSPTESESGLPSEIQVEQMMERAQALIAVMPVHGSRWVERDVDAAQAKGIPVMVVGGAEGRSGSGGGVRVLNPEAGSDEKARDEVFSNLRRFVQEEGRHIPSEKLKMEMEG